MIDCGPELLLRRPFSIHQVDSSGCLYILFVVIRKGTYWLSQRIKDTKLNVLGPLGNGFSINPDSKRLLLIGGGIGISPLVFLAHNALNLGKQVTLLIGARDKAQLYLQKLPQNLKTIIATEDGSTGLKGKVTDLLPDHVNEADQIFACGPHPMYQTIANLTDSLQLANKVQVSLETRMGCGIGTCYGCSIKTINGMKQVCKHGPVFNLGEFKLSEVKI
jgi:dihydroorotate dehydrogenase electron transfer subunit